jgi:hypothetical protein
MKFTSFGIQNPKSNTFYKFNKNLRFFLQEPRGSAERIKDDGLILGKLVVSLAKQPIKVVLSSLDCWISDQRQRLEMAGERMGARCAGV